MYTCHVCKVLPWVAKTFLCGLYNTEQTVYMCNDLFIQVQSHLSKWWQHLTLSSIWVVAAPYKAIYPSGGNTLQSHLSKWWQHLTLSSIWVVAAPYNVIYPSCGSTLQCHLSEWWQHLTKPSIRVVAAPYKVIYPSGGST